MNDRVLAWWVGVTPKLTGYIVVVIALVCTANVVTATRALEQERIGQFEQKGSVVALDVIAVLESASDDSVVRTLRLNKSHRGVRYILTTDKEGRLKHHTFGANVPEDLRAAIATAQREGLDDGLRLARQVTYRSEHGSDRVLDIMGTTPNGATNVHVGMDLELIEREAARMRNYMIAAGSAVSIAGIFVLLLVARMIVVRPVQELTRVTSEIVRKGDLTQEIRVTSEDEIGELARSFNSLMKRLREIPAALRESTELLAASVADLSAFTTGQSQTLTKQAAALQETQVTAQEIKQTSLVAAQKAEAVIQVTDRADAVSRSGEAAVEQSLKALFDMRAQVEEMATRIASLGEKTVQIGDITQTFA